MFGFDVALWHIKQGRYVTRKGWNGKGMYLSLTEPDCGCSGCANATGTTVPFITIATPKTLVPWVASQVDLLSEDWTLCIPQESK